MVYGLGFGDSPCGRERQKSTGEGEGGGEVWGQQAPHPQTHADGVRTWLFVCEGSSVHSLNGHLTFGEGSRGCVRT